MKHNKNFATTAAWIGKATVLALLAGTIAACENRNPNQPNAAVSPVPQPTATTTVVVTPAPQPAPTTTVVVTPAPQATPSPATNVINTPTTQPTSAATTSVVTSEPITNVVVITSAPDKQSLLNRRVQLTDVKVQNVNGDRTFWVTQTNSQPLFVLLDPPLDAGSAENKVVVKPGQNLDVTGVLKPMPNAQQLQQQWGLSASEAQAAQSQALYLQATQVKFK